MSDIAGTDSDGLVQRLRAVVHDPQNNVTYMQLLRLRDGGTAPPHWVVLIGEEHSQDPSTRSEELHGILNDLDRFPQPIALVVEMVVEQDGLDIRELVSTRRENSPQDPQYIKSNLHQVQALAVAASPNVGAASQLRPVPIDVVGDGFKGPFHWAHVNGEPMTLGLLDDLLRRVPPPAATGGDDGPAVARLTADWQESRAGVAQTLAAALVRDGCGAAAEPQVQDLVWKCGRARIDIDAVRALLGATEHIRIFYGGENHATALGNALNRHEGYETAALYTKPTRP